MGLCLTNTEHYLTIPEEALVEVPDVEHDGHVFSDGAGTISRALLESVWAKVGSDLHWVAQSRSAFEASRVS